jgi:hypothetical protein
VVRRCEIREQHDFEMSFVLFQFQYKSGTYGTGAGTISAPVRGKYLVVLNYSMKNIN